jgi:ABC-2 type transport system permease protein
MPLLAMVPIVNDPNGTLAVVMSWIPIFTPFVMMNRIAGSPPLSDIVGTTILLLASIALIVWLSGRIFRVGILRTGQPPKLLELLRLARG